MSIEMIKNREIIILFVGYVLGAVILLLPSISLAWTVGNNMIPCGFDGSRATPPNPNGTLEQAEQCQFSDFIQLLINVIDVLLFYATIIAAIAFAYAGFLYATNNGNPGRISSATKVFSNVAVGYIVALTAWLIIKTIEVALISSPNYHSLLSP